MPLLEIDEFVVKTEDIEAARRGDENAKERIRAALDGEQLYLHAFPVEDDEMVVKLTELERLNILDSIQLYAFTKLSAT